MNSIENSLRVMANTKPSMAHRRLQTISAWLTFLGIARKSGNSIELQEIPEYIKRIEVPDIDVPVLPRAGDLIRFQEVKRRIRSANQTIIHQIDGALLERRNAAHERLRDLLSHKILRINAVPTFNRLVDLAAHVDNHDYIIEVKSTVTNMRNQIRRGISQLYEYRYLQAMPNARLILCVEKPLESQDRWMVDYLVQDRGICLVWDDRDNELFTANDCENIPFL